MPFREKSAWISLICLLLTFGLFFLAQTHGLIPHGTGLTAQLFVAATLAFAALQIVLFLIAAGRSPNEARAPADERERIFALKAARNAYIALVVGIFLVPLSTHFGFHAPEIGYLAMAVLVASECMRHISKIVYFRSGL